MALSFQSNARLNLGVFRKKKPSKRAVKSKILVAKAAAKALRHPLASVQARARAALTKTVGLANRGHPDAQALMHAFSAVNKTIAAKAVAAGLKSPDARARAAAAAAVAKSIAAAKRGSPKAHTAVKIVSMAHERRTAPRVSFRPLAVQKIAANMRSPIPAIRAAAAAAVAKTAALAKQGHPQADEALQEISNEVEETEAEQEPEEELIEEAIEADEELPEVDDDNEPGWERHEEGSVKRG